MEKLYNILSIILSVMFGFLFGYDQDRIWWGVGAAIVCYILFFIGYRFSVMFAELDNGLKKLRNKKND